MDRWPWCDTCGEGTPREGRSWYCGTCRRERRRANQTRTQRTRRTAQRADPDTSALVTEVRRAAADLDAYLQRAQSQATQAGPQRQAADLIRATRTLADTVEARGLKPAKRPGRP